MEIHNRFVGYSKIAWGILSEEKDKGITMGGGFAGGVYGAHIFGTSVDVWTTVINGFIGLVYIGAGAATTKLVTVLFEKKIIPKIKFFSNDNEKEKDDQQRRA